MRWQFVGARNFHVGRRRRGAVVCRARLMVAHTMEALDLKLADGDQTAERVARWFASQPKGGVNGNGGSSAHQCTDADSTVQCVSVNDTAFAAPNANADGLHQEFAGFARFTRRDWLSPRGKQTLIRGAEVFAEWFVVMRRAGYHRPVMRLLTEAEIRGGRVAGFTDHRTITAAFDTPGGHLDPGEFFPWPEMLDQVETLVVRLDKPGFKPSFI